MKARFMLAAVAAVATVQSPVFARAADDAGPVAPFDQPLTILDANGIAVATLVPASGRTFRFRPIAATVTTPAAAPSRAFHPDVTRALTPQQLDAAFADERDRVFGITHTP